MFAAAQEAPVGIVVASQGYVLIIVNGEPHELTQPTTVAELLVSLAIDPRRITVVRNLEIMRRRGYGTTIRDGDRIDIMNLVAGG